ncbi:MAG TPA: PilN domain-containing protein [Tepidisphaeraceae bacterium]|nr:PilN domain-containing protein [Tepidisphaeraceae bacterium]
MNSPNELSFLPDDYMERKARRRAMALGSALLAIVIGGVGAALYITEHSMASVEQKHQSVVTKFTEAARRIEQVRKLHDQQRKIVQHAELAASLVERIPRSNILAELTNSLPHGTSLLDLSLESKAHQEPAPVAQTAFDAKKIALEAKRKADANGIEAPKYDVQIKVTGVADTDVQVAQYLTKLNHCPLFQDVNLVISDVYQPPEQKSITMRRFQVQMALNPRAEVKEGSHATETAAVDPGK